MFELRFIERASKDKTVKILQFRTKTKFMESTTTNPEPLVWTEWHDVPLIKIEQ